MGAVKIRPGAQFRELEHLDEAQTGELLQIKFCLRHISVLASLYDFDCVVPTDDCFLPGLSDAGDVDVGLDSAHSIQTADNQVQGTLQRMDQEELSRHC